MLTRVDLTLDCANPEVLAEFWKTAVGYVDEPPPAPFTTRDEWFAQFAADEDDDDGMGAAWLHDPNGVAPRLCLLQVPEPKAAKNRLYFDLRVSGDGTPEQKWSRVTHEVARLSAGKPVAWAKVAADARRGEGAHATLATVLGYVQAKVVTSACTHVPITREMVGADGLVADPTAREEITQTLHALLHDHDELPVACTLGPRRRRRTDAPLARAHRPCRAAGAAGRSSAGGAVSTRPRRARGTTGTRCGRAAVLRFPGLDRHRGLGTTRPPRHSATRPTR